MKDSIIIYITYITINAIFREKNTVVKFLDVSHDLNRKTL